MIRAYMRARKADGTSAPNAPGRSPIPSRYAATSACVITGSSEPSSPLSSAQASLNGGGVSGKLACG
jgi:hypothetical protein